MKRLTSSIQWIRDSWRSKTSSDGLNGVELPSLACALALAALAVGPTPSHADEHYHFSTISLAFTTDAKPDAVTGMGTDSGNQFTAQFEHFGVTNWGYFYFDAETYYGKHVGSVEPYGNNGAAFQNLINITPAISLSKITGHSFTHGLLSDISLIADVRGSSYYHYLAGGVGLSFNFAVPGFDWFETGVLTQDSWWDVQPGTGNSNTGSDYRLDKHKWLWRTYLISKPIDIASQRFNYVLFSFINTSGNGGQNGHGLEFFVRNDLTWEIGGHSDYQLGLRYEYARNQHVPFSDNTFQANVPYVILKITL
jgi:hypothetical protein